MEDLQAVAGDVIPERERDPAQPGGELLVRQPRDQQRTRVCVDVGHVGDRRGPDRAPQDADRPPAVRDLLALVASGQRDVLPLIILGRGVADRRLRDRYLVERDVGNRAVGHADPHQHRLAGVTTAALHRQVHAVRYRVHRHVPDVDVAGRAAQIGTDPRIHVRQVERLRVGRRARIGHVHREHRGRAVVGQEQDPRGSERERPRGPHVR